MSETKTSKKEQFFKVGGTHFITIMVGVFMLQIGLFVSQFLFQSSNLILNIFVFFALVFAFLLFKDMASESAKKFGFILFKIAIVIFVLMIANHFFVEMYQSIVERSGEDKASALLKLFVLIDLVIFVGSIAFFRNESITETFNNLYEQDSLAKFRIGGFNRDERKPGDVQLCIDKDTKKPVILRYKDRFLHMLILGPTGSGKTSQTIIPLINQDIQNLEAGVTVLEPKGDLAEKVYAMAEYYGRKAVYFNPLLPNCPYFNPLYGDEEDVVENIATTFRMLSNGSSDFFKDQNETLIRNSLKVLKRLYGNKATFIDFYRLITNSNGIGRKMITAFSRINAENEAIQRENEDIASYFLNDYFNEKSKTYEHCSDVRAKVSKIISNKYLRKVLNPPNGENDVDFDKILADGGVLTISTAQGKLRDLGRFLGYFLILQLQSAVFRRPGNENTRRAHFLYIDEFQVYANPGFADMLTQGRSYRVASHLATQNRALIGMGSGQEGKDFIELVSTNARNVVIYPGGNATDAKYYSDQFGEIIKHEVQKGVTYDQFNPLYGFQKIGYNKINVRKTEKKEARFSPSDIIYRPFGEITYLIIENNSISTPGVGKIQYIPKELNDKLDQMLEEYNQTIFKMEEEEESNEVLKELEEIQAEPIVEPVIATSVVEAEKQSNSQTYRGKEVISPYEEYIDDFVIEGTPKNEKKDNKKPENNLDFFSDEEDDLI